MPNSQASWIPFLALAIAFILLPLVLAQHDHDMGSMTSPTAASSSAMPKMGSSMNMTMPSGNSSSSKPRTVGIVVFPGFAGLDVFGPLAFITMLSTSYPINLTIIARTLDPVSTKTNMSKVMNGAMMDMSKGVGQSIGTRSIVDQNTDPSLLTFLRERANPSKLEYLLSVCTGASLLAKAGNLNGRRATTNKFSYSWVTSITSNVTWVPVARWVEDERTFEFGCYRRHGSHCILALETILRKPGGAVRQLIENAPHTNSSWDPYAVIWNVAGNFSANDAAVARAQIAGTALAAAPQSNTGNTSETGTPSQKPSSAHGKLDVSKMLFAAPVALVFVFMTAL